MPSWLTEAASRARRAARSGAPRVGQRPPVGEELSADLLRHRPPVQGDRAAGRRRVSLPQPQPGGVLGRTAHAAPPEDGSVLDDVVEPGLADLARAQGRIEAVILQRAEEHERAGQVVVGHDQRHAHLVVDVVGDQAEPLPDRPVAPALHGASQVNADQLAKHAGVDALADLLVQRDHEEPVTTQPMKQVVPRAGHGWERWSTVAGGRGASSGSGLQAHACRYSRSLRCWP